MALQHTAKELAELLEQVSQDLAKAMNGNSAAAQRVRTGTIKLGKVAKLFRKESVHAGKSAKGGKKKAAKKAAPKRKAAKKTARKTGKAAPKAAAKRPARKAKRRATRRK